MMKMNFHLKLAIGIIVVFGLLLLGFAMWTPVRVKYYAWQYRSPDVATRAKAVDGLIGLGKPGTEKLKAVYPDGPEAAGVLIECWDDVNRKIEDQNKAFSLLKLEKGWEVIPDFYKSFSYQHVAAFNGYLETVKLLMQKGGFMDCHGELWIIKPKGKEKGKVSYTQKCIYGKPIHATASSGRNQVIDYMLSQGIDVDAKDKDDSTPLHWAAWYGQTATAEYLISKGADVNAKDIGGETPLHRAAVFGQAKTAENLISKGADVNAKDDDGRTPLSRAAEKGHTKIAGFLISKGADVNARNNYGMTPLHLAARYGRTATAEFIISKGADVNAKDKLGWTPLHLAAKNDRAKTAELLISKGAEINPLITADRPGHIDNDKGKTPLDLAIISKRKETEKLLRSHGAKTGKELEAEKK